MKLTTEGKTSDRNYFVDLLKIIAIFLVIFHHVFYFAPTISNPIKYGFPFYIYQGVPIFMILSGFSWTLSLNKNKCNSLTDCFKPIFILKKFLRIFIPYLIIFLLMLIVAKCNNLYSDFNWIKGFFTGGLPGVGHYYIPLLFEMILFIPILYLIIKKWNIKGLIGLYIFNILFETIRWASNMPMEPYEYIIFRYTTVLAYGVYLGFNYKNKQNIWLSIIAFVVGIGCIVWFYYTPYKCKFFYSGNWEHSNFLTFLYIIPIIGFLVRNCKIRNKWVSYIGRTTFSIFLAQDFVFKFYNFFTFSQNEVAQIFIGVCFVLVVSIPVYLICEMIATKYSIKLIDIVNKKLLNKTKK